MILYQRHKNHISVQNPCLYIAHSSSSGERDRDGALGFLAAGGSALGILFGMGRTLTALMSGDIETLGIALTFPGGEEEEEREEKRE